MLRFNNFFELDIMNKMKTKRDFVRGQSLLEVLLGLAIGTLLLVAAVFALSGVLRSSTTIDKNQTASFFAQDLINRARSTFEGNWQLFSGVSTTNSFHYFLNATGTSFVPVLGEESMFENDITGGLVSHWKFDEDLTSPTVWESSGLSRVQGTIISGSPPRIMRTLSGCKAGNCFFSSSSLAAGEYIKIPTTSPNVFGTSNWSFSVWANPIDGGPSATYTVLNGIAHKPRLIIGTSSAQIGGFVSGTFQTILTSVGVSMNQWNHVVFLNDGTSNKIFINGQEKAATASVLIDSNFNELRIGSSGWGPENFWGKLDDARIYNRALSSEEVRRLYLNQAFKRYFYIEEVCRNTDPENPIVACSSGVSDPSTIKITAVVEWMIGGKTGTFSLSEYLTRWQNSAFWQTDWSQGVVSDSPVSEPGSGFGTSTDIEYASSGSIRILGL